MDVMEAARRIGLEPTSAEITGTIDEARVLNALAELAEQDPALDDLVADATARVRHARSAGFEQVPASSFAAADGAEVQLRYRSEMADVFTDLAIDVGLRRAAALVDSAP